MRNALSITFKDTPHTDHFVNYIENKFKRLKKNHHDIIQCTVIFTSPHHAHHCNNPKSVTITVRVPGKTLTARRTANPKDGRDLYATLSDAFAAIEMQATARSATKISIRNFRKASKADLFQIAS
jgi:ribosome-associated translation inhibitor RaiA